MGVVENEPTVQTEPRSSSLPRGYAPPDELRDEIRRSHKVGLWRPLVLVSVDLLSIAVAAAALVAAWRTNVLLAVPITIVLVLFISRQMRGLECLVHEASHWNWSRRSRTANDVLANVLAAWPVMSHVQDYRRAHQVHHAQLGSDRDADLLRWRRMDLEGARQRSPLRFMLFVLAKLPAYTVGWWWAIGVDWKTVLRFVLWHAVVVAGAALVFSPAAAITTWFVGVALPLFVVLPVLRFLGEIEEHRYGQVSSVLDSTYTNIGVWQLLLLHPHGEAYHTVHHLYPAVPGYRIAHLHRVLMRRDEGYASGVPIRREIFQPV